MAERIKLEVATPDGLALDTDVDMVTAPAVEGDVGVLPGHIPLLAAIRSGVLRYRVGNHEEVAAIGPGFVEAGATRVLLLTDAFAVPSAIDRVAASNDLAAAERGIAELNGPTSSREFQELQRVVDWARALLEAASPP